MKIGARIIKEQLRKLDTRRRLSLKCEQFIDCLSNFTQCAAGSQAKLRTGQILISLLASSTRLRQNTVTSNTVVKQDMINVITRRAMHHQLQESSNYLQNKNHIIYLITSCQPEYCASFDFSLLLLFPRFACDKDLGFLTIFTGKLN